MEAQEAQRCVVGSTSRKLDAVVRVTTGSQASERLIGGGGQGAPEKRSNKY